MDYKWINNLPYVIIRNTCTKYHNNIFKNDWIKCWILIIQWSQFCKNKGPKKMPTRSVICHGIKLFKNVKCMCHSVQSVSFYCRKKYFLMLFGFTCCFFFLLENWNKECHLQKKGQWNWYINTCFKMVINISSENKFVVLQSI